MGAESKEEGKGCFCPFCNGEIEEESFPFCQSCKVTVFYCPSCRKPLPRDIEVCPQCGAVIKGEKT